MDISATVLTPDLIEKGYTVTEYPQDNQVELKCHGEYIKDFCAVEEGTKPKHIIGIARQHYAIRNHLVDACRQTIDSGRGWGDR
jgi:hypothetical protein